MSVRIFPNTCHRSKVSETFVVLKRTSIMWHFMERKPLPPAVMYQSTGFERLGISRNREVR